MKRTIVHLNSNALKHFVTSVTVVDVGPVCKHLLKQGTLTWKVPFRLNIDTEVMRTSLFISRVIHLNYIVFWFSGQLSSLLNQCTVVNWVQVQRIQKLDCTLIVYISQGFMKTEAANYTVQSLRYQHWSRSDQKSCKQLPVKDVRTHRNGPCRNSVNSEYLYFSYKYSDTNGYFVQSCQWGFRILTLLVVFDSYYT